MSKNVLIIYPNCSMGGMATVFKNRALEDPDTTFTLVFTKDLGGKSYFDGLSNVHISIVRPDRLLNYIKYLTSSITFDSIHLTSLPNAFNTISGYHENVIYEFHSSSESILRKEISQLDFTLVKRVFTPSAFLKDMVATLLPLGISDTIEVVPNVVDRRLFNCDSKNRGNFNFNGRRPLVWIGRLDAGKNINDFIRLLSIADSSYVGVVVLGLEQDPKRFASYIGYASSLGVLDKIKTFVNLPQEAVAELFVAARNDSGFFISTSLGESFGFGVQEALDAGVDTVSYSVGALPERTIGKNGPSYTLVDVGDLLGMEKALHRS